MDMNKMHVKYGVHERINKLDKKLLKEFLEFRVACIEEELNECKHAIKENDADGIVDSIIDLVVFSIGTLDLYEVDVNKAWDEVYLANMNKQIGVKASRPNPYSLPDLVKPEGWKAPSHKDNLGKFDELFTDNL